ncbi:MAG: SIS domain-containing protein [Acidimicrobiia bacterium]
MCGIVAVLRRPVERTELPAEPTLAALERGVQSLQAAIEAGSEAGPAIDAMRAAATDLEQVAADLHGPRGVRFLLTEPGAAGRIRGLAETLSRTVAALDAALDRLVVDEHTEARNAASVRCKDAAWSIARDRLRTADGVAELVGRDTGWSAVEACTQIEQSLSAIDRLEVRGRDSAGILVLVRDHGLDPGDAAVSGLLAGRADDPLLRSGAVRVVPTDGGGTLLAFAYKAAAEIGELGDNTAAIRAQVVADELLHLAISGPDAKAVVLGHTRWASVGIISEANAHPLDSLEADHEPGPFVTAALNGDVDNFADLKASNGLSIHAEVTTDAKVIPTLVSRRIAAGDDHLEAFRATVASFEGSVAIAASIADRPNGLALALRGSGQALYVGLADDAYVVASEPYGVVEETDRYVRMDGETPANPDNPNASRGQILLLDGDRAGSLEGITRIAYDGTELPVGEDDVVTAAITTRDIDRGDFPHFLLKEVTEAPTSFHKTLRGRLVEDGDDHLRIVLPDESLPADVRRRLADGSITRILAIGQGTAAIASQGLAAMLEDLADRHGVQVEAVPATELSGFRLRPDMSDTLVIATSQSGTTTDTNRTVDLVRARKASVIAIVNRRGSDLTDRADGVLYTSDGRDVEMAVPSTKAFYAQIAAGTLLALAIASEWGEAPDQELLRAMRDLPDAMRRTLETRPAIAEAAHEWCPPRRYWAMVGNGTNRIAAEELRIKLSELCYKSIACDATEDKKHIDLSSEPLILVCAAGLSGSNVDDVAKEVAIYRAHKAAPIVIATEGEGRFAAALSVLTVPETHEKLAFVLATMVGHLFGYEAALAIDAQALPLKEVRAAIEGAIESGATDGERVLGALRREALAPVARFFDGLRAGRYDGHLEASTAVRAANLLRYASGAIPLDAYQLDHGKVGTPSVLVEDLTAALTRAIDELTRPIDAIKHQAKTVTVGISRTDESLLEVALVRAVLDAGAPRDRLTYKNLRTLADVSPAIEEVTGYTRYRIEGPIDDRDGATITVVDRGGIARDLPLRTEQNPVLRGTKHQVATDQELLVGRGRSDDRTIVIVPEVKDGATTGITLLHVRFADRLSAAAARGVLSGYRRRLAELRDAVTETEPTFRDDLLAEVPVVDLLTQPVGALADRWRT